MNIAKTLGLVNSFLFNKYPYADFIITERCNMKCKMCDYWKREPGKEMDYDDILLISEKLKKLGGKIISITGGEPLLKKDIINIITLFSKNFFVILNTNGTLINKEMAEKLMNSGLYSLNISVDSLTNQHDEQRGVAGTLNKATNALNLLKDSDINLSIKAVLTKMNENEIEDLINFAKDNNIKIGFNFYTEMMSGEKPNFSLSNPIETIKKMLQLKKKYRNTIISTYYYLQKALDYYQGNLPVCQAGLFYFSVFPDGNIYRCAKLRDELLTNIKEDDLDVLKRKLKGIKPTQCNDCWVSCRGEVDPFKTDFLNKAISYIKYK